MVIESFDKKLYATVEDNIFALDKIPTHKPYSVDFDKVLPVKKKIIYIPTILHPWKRHVFEKFLEKYSKQELKQLV